MMSLTSTLNTLLCQHHLITQEQAEIALQEAIKNNIPLITSVVLNKFASSAAILLFCSDYFKLPTVKLNDYDTAIFQDCGISAGLIDRYHLLPIQKDSHSLHIALSDPTDQVGISFLRFHTGLAIHPVLVDESELDHIIKTYCRANILYSQLQHALGRIHAPVTEIGEVAHDSGSEEPVIQFVNQLLHDAIHKSVSDIHIEAFAESCRIRFRRDGLLYEAATLPHHFSIRMVTRLKIMANLDITEKRLPQDGRIHYQHRQPVDLRVSTCPALHGENMVLRLLRHASEQLSFDALGMSTQQQIDFQQALNRPQGLILVSGPTGSGKTATLYAALQTLNQPDKNILTVEDPVEIDVAGITQVNINPRIGLDFAKVLRAFLRQDPDIMMVGEIRDVETAMIAVQAAQTGHLVLATLHANNAADCIKRLLALGIPSCQLAGALSLLAAQRLVRKICQHCSSSCEHCCEGYLGRAGIFEIYPITAAVTQLLLSDAPLTQIEHQFINERYQSLHASGQLKVNNGITTQAELTRILGNFPHAGNIL